MGFRAFDLSFFKNPNGDELYSVTAVYKRSDYTGELIPDMEQSKNLRFCRVDELPEMIKIIQRIEGDSDMDVLEAIFTRRSIRKFTGEPLTDQELETVIRAGFQAPSAHNYQPWEFMILRDKSNMERIAKVHTYAKMLPNSEACIIVCGDKKKQTTTGFLIEDCSAAIQNILLAAHGIGLGAVWCGLYPITHLTDEVTKICSLPEHIVPVGMVVIGHKGEVRKQEDRFDSSKLHYEVW